jgi:hypothetical protein
VLEPNISMMAPSRSPVPPRDSVRYLMSFSKFIFCIYSSI